MIKHLVISTNLLLVLEYSGFISVVKDLATSNETKLSVRENCHTNNTSSNYHMNKTQGLIHLVSRITLLSYQLYQK